MAAHGYGYDQGHSSYGHHQTVVVTSPQQCYPQTHVHPPDYMCLSIVAIFFFWPLAICAIMYSSNSRTSMTCGDVDSAACHGRTARNLAVSSIIIGIVGAIIVVGVRVGLQTTYCINC